MMLSELTAETAASAAVETLGLDSSAVDLTSTEALAASLRRAASFMCPTSPGRLIDAVHGAVQPLSGACISRTDIAEILEQIVGAGDLLELRHDNGRSTRLLYLAPPSFIEVRKVVWTAQELALPLQRTDAGGQFGIVRDPHYLGLNPNGLVPLIEDELSRVIDYQGHTRSIRLDGADGPAELRERGIRAVAKDRWVSRPAAEAPEALMNRYLVRLDVAGEAGEQDGIQLLDPTASVRYYTDRWRTPISSDTGDFIARRPQAYGADLWCLIRFEDGAPKRLIELPVNDPVVPGRDEAWRYQAAVDAARGLPQRFRRRASGSHGDERVFDFFSPLPGFAERYLQLAGLALGRTPGALFSFRVPLGACDDAAAFLTDMLWMEQEEAPSGV